MARSKNVYRQIQAAAIGRKTVCRGDQPDHGRTAKALHGCHSPFQMLQVLRGFARSPDAAPGVGIYIHSSRLKETSMKLSEELNLQEQKIKRLEHQMVIAKRQRDVWAAIAVVSIGRITFYRL